MNDNAAAFNGHCGFKEDNEFFGCGKRGLFVQTTSCYEHAETRLAAEGFGRDMMGLVREADTERSVQKMSLAYNTLFGQDMGEAYSTEVMEELKSVKGVWGPKREFWSPAVDEGFQSKGPDRGYV
ncbi:hypothetical protein K432DRAFT_384042 [Lepidopterella palustris CBS 459.81]|uniref:Uncharacterized protein n=1 Tax=Lepidopterella palustris CBS 459.81 TaxID=1314670 RepID=A0A8E2E6E2_9PEZI|nr:hypothetical protein K432DRAFT_384042 [Lepidopterella palustris CBS 459.81]